MSAADFVMQVLKEVGVFELIKARLKRMKMGPAWKAKFAAFFFVPFLISGIYMIHGGGLSIDFGKGLAISELKSEVRNDGPSSSRRAVLVIAEPVSMYSDITIKNNSARIWTSLDDVRAQRNLESNHLSLKGSVLHVQPRFFSAEQEPVAVVVEGEVDDELEINGQTQSLRNWRLSSRRSGAIVSAVLINCFMALGVGLATSATAPIYSEKNDGRKKRTKPNKK